MEMEYEMTLENTVRTEWKTQDPKEFFTRFIAKIYTHVGADELKDFQAEMDEGFDLLYFEIPGFDKSEEKLESILVVSEEQIFLDIVDPQNVETLIQKTQAAVAEVGEYVQTRELTPEEWEDRLDFMESLFEDEDEEGDDLESWEAMDVPNSDEEFAGGDFANEGSEKESGDKKSLAKVLPLNKSKLN